MQSQHIVKHLSFGEDASQPWTKESKLDFITCLRENYSNSQIHSINIYCTNLLEHNEFISEVSILCRKNRNYYIIQKNNQQRIKQLNINDPEYYDCDDHVENAFKFSVKTYMSNVIDTLLDEGLYFLEKVRANTTRDDKIFDINKEPINKQILEDLFTADGSILALARYMIEKIKNNPRLIGEDKSEESAQITENKV